jgi:hypothetical protein
VQKALTFFQVHGRRSSKGVQAYEKVKRRNGVWWSVVLTFSTRSIVNHCPEVPQCVALCAAIEAYSQVDVIVTIWSSTTLHVHLYVVSIHALQFVFREQLVLDGCSLQTAHTRMPKHNP